MFAVYTEPIKPLVDVVCAIVIMVHLTDSDCEEMLEILENGDKNSLVIEEKMCCVCQNLISRRYIHKDRWLSRPKIILSLCTRECKQTRPVKLFRFYKSDPMHILNSPIRESKIYGGPNK